MAPRKAAEPPPARIVAVTASVVGMSTVIFLAARGVADEVWTPLGLIVSLGGGLLFAVLIGSLGEWLVHRYLMHRRCGLWLLDLAYDLHHRAHHWVQFPPDEYVHEDRVQRVPVSARLDHVCTTHLGRALTVTLHVAFYSSFGLLLAVLPALIVTHNPLFTAMVAAVVAVEIYLFVRIHDAVHHPGLSRLERFGWFRFLDRHHYIHHVDTRANTNFLLPLCDLLMGVLRRELTPLELSRWPTYEEARQNAIHPTFDDRGVRNRTDNSNQENPRWQRSSPRSSSRSRASRT